MFHINVYGYTIQFFFFSPFFLIMLSIRACLYRFDLFWRNYEDVLSFLFISFEPSRRGLHTTRCSHRLFTEHTHKSTVKEEFALELR